MDVEVVDEGYDDGDPSAARTFAIGQVACRVTVYDINRSGTYYTDPASTHVATETVVTEASAAARGRISTEGTTTCFGSAGGWCPATASTSHLRIWNVI